MTMLRVTMATFLVLFVSSQDLVRAQTMPHVVSPEDLRTAVKAEFVLRKANVEEIQKLLRHEVVQKQTAWLIDLERIANVVPTLDDNTLNRLAQESRKVNDQLCE